jgi:hypothetical protein
MEVEKSCYNFNGVAQPGDYKIPFQF